MLKSVGRIHEYEGLTATGDDLNQMSQNRQQCKSASLQLDSSVTKRQLADGDGFGSFHTCVGKVLLVPKLLVPRMR